MPAGQVPLTFGSLTELNNKYIDSCIYMCYIVIQKGGESMDLNNYLKNKGVDKETRKIAVVMWELGLPNYSNEINDYCWEWWNIKREKRLKHEQKLERTKNKTN